MSYNYNPSSQKAEEFINHEEILETLSYAEKNKNNVELIDQILAKARLRKGLSHREAAVLLDCEIPEKVEEIFELARQIKQDFYGNRIVMFAPLYLSNYWREWLRVLSIPHEKQAHCQKEADAGGNPPEVIALQDMDINVWRWRRARIRLTARSNMCWTVSRQFTVSSIKTGRSAGSMSILRRRRWRITGS